MNQLMIFYRNVYFLELLMGYFRIYFMNVISLRISSTCCYLLRKMVPFFNLSKFIFKKINKVNKSMKEIVFIINFYFKNCFKQYCEDSFLNY